MTMFQFMVEAVTGVLWGKKQKTQIHVRNIKAATLMGRPIAPNDQRRSGRVGPLIRRMIRQVMEMM